MPFIPHTDRDIQSMLQAIQVAELEHLFDEIPAPLRSGELTEVPPAQSEWAITRLMERRAATDGQMLSFLGGGAYEHHIPAAVWQLVGRGEFYSAYTPYQAEASQGTLQLLYEYQTMMASLNGLEVSNASLYDGATALAEAILMAVRSQKQATRVLLPDTVHPLYRQAVRAIIINTAVELVDVAHDPATGTIGLPQLQAAGGDGLAALVIPYPNVFGQLEDVDALTDWAHAQGGLVIGVSNPTALAALKPPGQWGSRGADIGVGEGQPLGLPLSNGGPYFGFMTCREAIVRQMPGRLIGRTVDRDGKTGFTLTLQAREQHIRRAKATSNICTNQGLMVTAATIYMGIIGPKGLRAVAAASHANTRQLVDALCTIPGVSRAFSGPYFHEAALRLPRPVPEVLRALQAKGILGGLDCSDWFPALSGTMLVCATETKTAEDIEHYRTTLAAILA